MLLLQSAGGPKRATEEVYFGEIVCSPDKISKLSAEVNGQLITPGSLCDPQFFLASIDERSWTPLVVVVSRAGSTVGIVYAKERKFAGITSGLVYADSTLGAMVVAEPSRRNAVLHEALNRLLNRTGIRGLRILIPPEGFERDVIQKILDSRSLDVHSKIVENHMVFDLASNYEAFLAGLGKKTRRNFRYYRKRFEADGHSYVENVPADQFQHAAHGFLAKSVIGAERSALKRAMAMLTVARRPIMVGLRHKNGQLLSILAGWHESDQAIVFFQMNNDREYPHICLCTVLRGYLIESLIARNIRSLLFWAGVGGSLLRYRRAVPVAAMYLDAPTFTWRAMRRVFGWTTDFLPVRMRHMAGWIVPENLQGSAID